MYGMEYGSLQHRSAPVAISRTAAWAVLGGQHALLAHQVADVIVTRIATRAAHLFRQVILFHYFVLLV